MTTADSPRSPRPPSSSSSSRLAQSSRVPHSQRPYLRKRLRQVVLMMWALTLLGAVAMVGGAGLNARAIDSDPGRALAHVTGVGAWRTTVEYQDEEGLYHAPQQGLLYPTGLGEGQNVWVRYARSNPDVVAVEGRTWTLTIVPAASVAVVGTAVMGLLWWAVGVATRERPSRRAVS